jgi:acetate kinase
VIIGHLGSGASLCALEDGRSLDTTMGFTPLDGLPMGTRPGQLDPGIMLYLILDWMALLMPRIAWLLGRHSKMQLVYERLRYALFCTV